MLFRYVPFLFTLLFLVGAAYAQAPATPAAGQATTSNPKKDMNSVSWCGVGDNPIDAVISLHSRVMSVKSSDANLLFRDSERKNRVVNVSGFKNVELVSLTQYKEKWYACGILRE